MQVLGAGSLHQSRRVKKRPWNVTQLVARGELWFRTRVRSNWVAWRYEIGLYGNPKPSYATSSVTFMFLRVGSGSSPLLVLLLLQWTPRAHPLERTQAIRGPILAVSVLPRLPGDLTAACKSSKATHLTSECRSAHDQSARGSGSRASQNI